MNAKQKYRELCKTEPSIPIFCLDWWMDAVCGEENWDVFIVEKGTEVVAALPYYVTRGKYGLKIITLPKLTQFNGVWIKYPENQKYINKIAYEKKLFGEIISQIDDAGVAYFNQHFHYSITNWLPFFWKDFKQSTRYTYVIEDTSDMDKIIQNFDSDKRREIKKAAEILSIKYNLSAEQFYALLEATYSQTNEGMAYSFEFFERIYRAVYDHNAGITIYD